MDAKRYTYDDINSICQRVIIARPGGDGPITIYVPPINGELPYTVVFEDYDVAVDFAAAAQIQLPPRTYLMETHDHVPWYLVNLKPVG